MADATRLAIQLCGKLEEFEGVVANFQRDMQLEFQRHMEDYLQNVPGDVTREVYRMIYASLPNYPLLYPKRPHTFPEETSDSTRDSSPPMPELRRWKGKGRSSPPPTLRHTSGIPKDGPSRNPHAREKEFHGVFTPGFLPLLETGDGAKPSTSSPPPTTESSAPIPTPRVTRPQTPTAGQFTSLDGKAGGQESEEEDEEETREWPNRRTSRRLMPGPSRRATNLSTSSVESVGSSDARRRGGLRRSSSSARGSPRRVRFEVQGREVLPSSSPQPPLNALVEHVEDRAERAPGSPAIGLQHETYSVSSSLLDVEGEEDSLPKPKKVSSTQALQALTRTPMVDDNTVWRVINGDPADATADSPVAHEAPTVNGGLRTRDLTRQAPTAVPSSSKTKLKARTKSKGKQPLSLYGYESNFHHPQDKDSDDDDFLSFKSKAKKSIPPAASRSSPLSRNFDGVAGPSSSLESSPSHHHGAQTEPTEDFFEFEGEGAQAPNQTKYLTEEPEDVEEEVPADMDQPTAPVPGAREIPRASPPVNEDGTSQSLLSRSISQSVLSRSIGSYKGQQVTSCPVKDAHLYEEIVNMDVVDHFVGSIDGRSGPEAADMGSYRASLGNGATLSTTPRSLSERFALEEALKKAKLQSGEGSATFGSALADVEEELEPEGVDEERDAAPPPFGPTGGIDIVAQSTERPNPQGADTSLQDANQMTDRLRRENEEREAAKRDAQEGRSECETR